MLSLILIAQIAHHEPRADRGRHSCLDPASQVVVSPSNGGLANGGGDSASPLTAHATADATDPATALAASTATPTTAEVVAAVAQPVPAASPAAAPSAVAAHKASAARRPTSRHADLDEDGNEVVRVGRMSRCFVKYPWAVALSTFLLVCLLSAAGAQGFSEPVNTGWDNQQDPIRQRFDAYWKLMDQGWAPGLDKDDGNDRSRRLAAADWPQGGKRPTPGSWRAETAGPLTRLEWAEGRAVGVLGPEAYRRRSAWQGRRQRQLLEYNGEADVSLERSLVLDVVTLVYDAFEGCRMLSLEALEAMMGGEMLGGENKLI